jgi:hypothetical protein
VRAAKYARSLELKTDSVGQTEGHQPIDRVTLDLD